MQAFGRDRALWVRRLGAAGAQGDNVMMRNIGLLTMVGCVAAGVAEETGW